MREEKEDKLKQALDTLNKKHGSTYTQLQYRIWSELYANGMHTDLDTPPNNSMFKRATGLSTPTTKKKQAESTSPEMAEAITQAASQISSAIVAALLPGLLFPEPLPVLAPAQQK